MKKIFLILLALLLIAAALYFSIPFIQSRFFAPPPVPKTTFRMIEGSASIYAIDAKGEKEEYKGVLNEGETMTVARSQEAAAPFDAMNIIQRAAHQIVPQAVNAFKIIIGKLSEDFPIGVYTRFFTEEEFDEYIGVKLRRSWLPNFTVTFDPEGFKATGTIVIGNSSIPFYGIGIVGTDPQKYGSMYLRFSVVRIDKFKIPRFMLDAIENESNKMMGRGGYYAIEILNMSYRDKGIDITFRRTEPPRNIGRMSSSQPRFVKEEEAKAIEIPDILTGVTDMVENPAAQQTEPEPTASSAEPTQPAEQESSEIDESTTY